MKNSPNSNAGWN